MTRGRWIAVAALALLSAAPAAAQSPGKPDGVQPSATVEVIEDPSQVDDVIARLKHPPAQTQATPAKDRSDDLKTERPALPQDPVENDKGRPLTKAERRARQQERLRREH